MTVRLRQSWDYNGHVTTKTKSGGNCSSWVDPLLGCWQIRSAVVSSGCLEVLSYARFDSIVGVAHRVGEATDGDARRIRTTTHWENSRLHDRAARRERHLSPVNTCRCSPATWTTRRAQN